MIKKAGLTIVGILISISSVFSQKLTMQRQYLSILIDASYSMGLPLGESTKMSQVQDEVINFLTKLENYGEIQTSLSAFGSSNTNFDTDKCSDYKEIVPFEIGNLAKIKAQVKRIEAKGSAPVGYAIEKTIESIPANGTKKYSIVILDGSDACSTDFCEIFNKCDSLTNGIFIIGFGISKEDQIAFECCPTFANADSQEELAQSFTRIFETIKPY